MVTGRKTVVLQILDFSLSYFTICIISIRSDITELLLKTDDSQLPLWFYWTYFHKKGVYFFYMKRVSFKLDHKRKCDSSIKCLNGNVI